MRHDAYIICAGNGSRMGTSFPKSLTPIVSAPCLTETLQKIGHKFDTVYIVYNDMLREVWHTYLVDLARNHSQLYENITPIGINSGLGDGHAVLAALDRNLQHQVAEDVTVIWGDVFIRSAEIIDELLSRSLEPTGTSGYIPVVMEKNPYVSLFVDGQLRCMSADFSKHGENHSTGFHDQSIFRFNRQAVHSSLQDLHAAFWKNGRYISPSGELSLLYCFHHMYNNNKPMRVYETAYPTLSFNSPLEIENLRRQLQNES